MTALNHRKVNHYNGKSHKGSMTHQYPGHSREFAGVSYQRMFIGISFQRFPRLHEQNSSSSDTSSFQRSALADWTQCGISWVSDGSPYLHSPTPFLPPPTGITEAH